MTNKEAIADLKFIKETNILDNLHMSNEALDLAIKALEEIPTGTLDIEGHTITFPLKGAEE